MIELNQRPNARFTVELHFWEELTAQLTELDRAVADWIVWQEPANVDSAFRNPLTTVPLTETVNQETATEGGDDFSEIEKLFEERRIDVAAFQIEKLPDAEQDQKLSNEQRYPILRLKGKLALEQLKFDEAVRLFELAYELCPELPQARINHVLALEFSGDKVKAFDAACQLFREGERSPSLLTLLVRTASNVVVHYLGSAQREAFA